MRGRILTRIPVLVAVGLLIAGSPAAYAQTPASTAPPRIFIEDQPGESDALGVIDALGPRRSFAIGVHRVVQSLEEDAAEAVRKLEAWRGHPLWLAIPAPASTGDMARWQTALRQLLAQSPARIAILEVRFDAQPEALLRYAVQIAATEARARTATQMAAGGVDAAATRHVAESLTAADAPYIDLLAVGDDSGARDAIERFRTTIPDGRIIVRRDVRPDDASAALAREVLQTVATETIATAWRGGEALADALEHLLPLSELLTHTTEPLDAAAAGLTLAGKAAGRVAWHRLLFDAETFTTYLAYEAPAGSGALDVALRLAIKGTVVVIDPVSGERQQITPRRWNDEDSRIAVSLPSTGRPMLVNFSEGAEQVFVDRASATAARQLAVEEIVAAHRRYAARLDTLVANYRASARMEQHFRPSLTDPGYDVVTENNFFVDRDGTEWEELSFSVNGSKWGADRPAFPLLQAEKVLSLPLELRLTQDYRYTLVGTEQVDGVECYRISFEPIAQAAALYRGTVWIDRQTFARVKVQAVQSRTSAPVVSNEEIHEYDRITEIDGFPVRLLTRLTARQIVLIAGRNLLLEKATTFSNFHVNDRSFGELRGAARRGERVMYRDTTAGVRYYIKDGDTRVVSERATAHAKAMAMGVMVDPSFAFPLPIFGINYLDFEFRGRPDTQLAVLFGGVLLAGNLQRPRVGGTPLDISVDFFGIAAPASDRLYLAGGERATERLLTWPLTTGLNVGWQYTPFQKGLLQYHLRYDAFVRDRTTSESFEVPDSAITQGIGGQWEYRRGGYSLVGSGTWFARSTWTPWGPAEALERDPARTYAKYAVHLSKDWFFNAFHKVHLNGSYFGGSRLDRFSRYQFGMFDDTRIHGVPASGVRFDEIAMIRGSYSLNIFEQYRVDLFLEQARGRDRTLDATWRGLTGVGAAVNFRAPWNTILRADIGKSRLPAVYRDVGSVVFQIMVLKPLR